MSGGSGFWAGAASLCWLIPLLPLAAFALLALGMARVPRLGAWLAVCALGGSLALAALGLGGVVAGARPVAAVPWLSVGGRDLSLAVWLDPLGAVTTLLVALVGFVVFVYAVAYMRGDPHYGRFFAELSLFIGAMLTLTLAADLITLFIAWELVGLSSYLLIGFWHEREGAPAAASKAFLTTRLADLALLAGVLLLIGATGSGRIGAALAAATQGHIAAGTLLLIALLVAVGAAGKSAQLPFQGWLPDAMLGPTPVSALLHSATMVAAGVFLIARLYPLFLAASAHPALTVVAWVGALTALFGGIVALAQTDLKRLLAYSTMSQIGLMFVGLGAGSLLAGMLLLIAQALYKSTLFLAAGAVDHAVEGTDMARMGGLARRMPVTFVVFVIAAAALAGLPVTLALPAKDAVLAVAAQANGALFIVAALASLFTALYSARAVGVVWLGRASAPASHAHESPRGLLAPMLALGALIVVGLLVNGQLVGQPLQRLLGGSAPSSGGVTALALLIAALGVVIGLLARVIWPARVVWPPVAWVAPVLRGEFGLRPVYRGIAHGGLLMAQGLAAFDRVVFDPLGLWAARGLLALVRGVTRFDVREVDGGVRVVGRGLLAASQRLRRIQTGMVGNYLLGIVLWGLGVVIVAVVALALR